MRKLALALLLLVLAGVVVSDAAAEHLHANVHAWSPNDVRPGEPVFVVLELYMAGDSPSPKDGIPIAGVKGVEVVIYGEGQSRRFTTEDVGGGRYATEIVFPRVGGWDLHVRYAAGSYGAGDEILLGKGAICVGGGLCVAGQVGPSTPALDEGGAPRTALALAVGGVMVALAAAALIRHRVRTRVLLVGGQPPRRRRSSRARVSSSRRSPSADLGASAP